MCGSKNSFCKIANKNLLINKLINNKKRKCVQLFDMENATRKSE